MRETLEPRSADPRRNQKNWNEQSPEPRGGAPAHRLAVVMLVFCARGFIEGSGSPGSMGLQSHRRRTRRKQLRMELRFITTCHSEVSPQT